MPHSEEFNPNSDTFLEKLWRGIHRWKSSLPFLVFWEDDVGVNEGKWCIRINALTFRLRTLNDAETGSEDILACTRGAGGFAFTNITFGSPTVNCTYTFNGTGLTTFGGGIKHGDTKLLATSVALTNGAGAAAGTLANAPVAGNPTKWIPIDDNGTTRYIPAW